MLVVIVVILRMMLSLGVWVWVLSWRQNRRKGSSQEGASKCPCCASRASESISLAACVWGGRGCVGCEVANVGDDGGLRLGESSLTPHLPTHPTPPHPARLPCM